MFKNLLKIIALVTIVTSAFLYYVFNINKDIVWQDHIQSTLGGAPAMMGFGEVREMQNTGSGKLRVEKLVINSATGTHILQVEMADSKENQIKGLMHRKTMADDAGMLFIYEQTQDITMWMKNTILSLDMVFISEAGKITHIAYSAQPFALDIISSNGPAKAVLEIKAGIAEKLGLKIGDKVWFPASK